MSFSYAVAPNIEISAASFSFLCAELSSLAVFPCILTQPILHSILTRCHVPAGPEWPTACCYTTDFTAGMVFLRCRQCEICTRDLVLNSVQKLYLGAI